MNEQQPQASADPLESLLRSAPLNDRQRAGLWDMYETAANPDDLAARLRSMQLPDEVKAQLWDLKSQEADAAKPATWSDRLGLNQPSDSMLGGFLRGAGAGAVDLAQGAVSNISGQLNSKLNAENVTRQDAGMAPTVTLPDVQSPGNFPGKVGEALPMVGEAMLGGAPAVKTAVNMIPSATRAGAKFQQVMAAAKDVPIETKAVGDAALRIQQLADRGSSMPLAVSKLLRRMTDPAKAPMAYEEARDFASNISRLSVNEMGRLTPNVAREVANLRVVLNEANAQAAKQAGKMAEYKSAMREYSQAMRLRDAIDSAVKGAKKAALPTAAAAGGAYWLTREVKSFLGGGRE